MLHHPMVARPMDWMRRCHTRRLVNWRGWRRLVNCWLLIYWRRWGRVSHIGRWIIIGGCSVEAKGRKAEPAAIVPTAMTPATVAPAAPTTREGRV